MTFNAGLLIGWININCCRKSSYHGRKTPDEWDNFYTSGLNGSGSYACIRILHSVGGIVTSVCGLFMHNATHASQF